jgi:Trk K+ transport system NAD-binding subunit
VRILYLDADSVKSKVRSSLVACGHFVVTSTSRIGAINALGLSSFDLAIADIDSIGRDKSLDFIQFATEIGVPVIVYSNTHKAHKTIASLLNNCQSIVVDKSECPPQQLAERAGELFKSWGMVANA